MPYISSGSGLSIIPLTLSVFALIWSNRVRAGLSAGRQLAFRTALVLSFLASGAVTCAWADPLVAVRLKPGGYTVLWFDVTLLLSTGTSFVALLLSFAGRGLPRALLAMAAVLLIALTFGALLQNGV